MAIGGGEGGGWGPSPRWRGCGGVACPPAPRGCAQTPRGWHRAVGTARGSPASPGARSPRHPSPRVPHSLRGLCGPPAPRFSGCCQPPAPHPPAEPLSGGGHRTPMLPGRSPPAPGGQAGSPRGGGTHRTPQPGHPPSRPVAEQGPQAGSQPPSPRWRCHSGN